ncbi:MAG: DUF5662 family protein [Bacilli bacterium]
MKYFFKHLATVNKHKWEVFKLCVKVGIPFRGIMHDLSKFSYEEIKESVKYYKKSNGKYSPLAACKRDIGYSPAWLHHFGRNKHHFEYWYDYCAPVKMPIIPFKYMLEMICDRIAASKTYNKKNYNDGKVYEYFMDNKKYYNLNPHLLDYLEEVFLEFKNKGEIILNKKYLYELYIKYSSREEKKDYSKFKIE